MAKFRRFTQDELSFIKDSNLTIDEIAKKLNRKNSSIRTIMSKLKIKCKKRKRKYYVEENYFNNQSDNVFYIIGFTMADGNIEISSEIKQRIRYCIAEKDKEVLEFIAKEISPQSPIRIYNRKNNRIEANLSLFSNKLCNDIKNFGIIPNKTRKEELINIPEKYKYSYLRGLFDGDGTIGLYNYSNNRRIVNIRFYSASRIFLENLRTFEGNNLGSLRTYPHGESFISTWSIQSLKEVVFLGENMYKNANFYLKRKNIIFTKILNYANN